MRQLRSDVKIGDDPGYERFSGGWQVCWQQEQPRRGQASPRLRWHRLILVLPS